MTNLTEIGGTPLEAGGGELLVHERAAAMDEWLANEDHFAMSVEISTRCARLSVNGNAFLVQPHDFPWSRSAHRDPMDGACSSFGPDYETRSAEP